MQFHRSTLLIYIFSDVLTVDIDGFRVHLDRVDPNVDCTRALILRSIFDVHIVDQDAFYKKEIQTYLSD